MGTPACFGWHVQSNAMDVVSAVKTLNVKQNMISTPHKTTPFTDSGRATPPDAIL